MKKIGLINIQHCDSHGAVLLAYAMEKVMSQFGYKAVNLDYVYAGRIVENNIYIRILKNIFDKIKKTVRVERINKSVAGQRVYYAYLLQHRNFNKFRKKYLTLTKRITNPSDNALLGYDAYIVGSDVVWKPEIVRCEDKKFYFLKFADSDSRKIAYSASVGTNDEVYLNKFTDYYNDAFDCFDFISIREQSMIDFIKRYTDKPVTSVIDPVFLVDREVFTSIEVNNHQEIKNKPYIYLYVLGENHKAIIEAQKMADLYGYDILVDLNSDFNNSKIITANIHCAISDGPDAFIYNIRNAKYIITDSFHATAFALIYNISFCVFGRSNISVRMNDLLSRFGLSSRKYNGSIPVDEIEWEKVNNQIEEEKNYGISYLKEALKDV